MNVEAHVRWGEEEPEAHAEQLHVLVNTEPQLVFLVDLRRRRSREGMGRRVEREERKEGKGMKGRKEGRERSSGRKGNEGREGKKERRGMKRRKEGRERS